MVTVKYPTVTEKAITLEEVAHDPFIDGLVPARPVADAAPPRAVRHQMRRRPRRSVKHVAV